MIEYAFSLPLDDLPSRALFQGAAAAVDPRDSTAYLFQAQAKAVGPGDVEDISIHRYRMPPLVDGIRGPAGITYLDTMIGKTFGHVQSFHIRISTAGNPWVWLGAEKYDARNQGAGYDLLRVRYRRGIIDRTSPDVQRIWTGPGAVQAISCPDWTVCLRRPGKTTETYEWHDERALTGRLESDPRPAPAETLTVPRSNTTYQSAAAGGPWTDPQRLHRVNGATEDPTVVTTWRKGGWQLGEGPTVTDLTAAAPPGLTVTSEEGEAVFELDGQTYVGKRFNSTRRRVVAYFRVT